MLRRLQANKTFVCAYKILRFCGNPQKFQTLVPTKSSHFKVANCGKLAYAVGTLLQSITTAST